MKKWSLGMLLLAAVFWWTMVGEGDIRDEMTEILGVDVRRGEIAFEEDTHGGFHGDGTRFVILDFSEDAALRETILKNPSWRALPMDKVTALLAYGGEENGMRYMPMLQGEDISSTLPQIDSGWYCLIDRQEDEREIMDRESFNLTLGIYDEEARRLYYAELDT